MTNPNRPRILLWWLGLGFEIQLVASLLVITIAASIGLLAWTYAERGYEAAYEAGIYMLAGLLIGIMGFARR